MKLNITVSFACLILKMQLIKEYQSLIAQGRHYDFALKIKSLAKKKITQKNVAEALLLCLLAADRLADAGKSKQACELLGFLLSTYENTKQSPGGAVGPIIKACSKMRAQESTEILLTLDKQLEHSSRDVSIKLAEIYISSGKPALAFPHVIRIKDVKAALDYLLTWQKSLSPLEKQLALCRVATAFLPIDYQISQSILKQFQRSAFWRLAWFLSQSVRLKCQRVWEKTQESYKAALSLDPILGKQISKLKRDIFK